MFVFGTHTERKEISGGHWLVIAWWSAGLCLFGYLFLNQPVAASLDERSIWATNRLGQVASPTIPWLNVERVYVEQVRGGFRSSSYHRLVVESVTGSHLEFGQVNNSLFIDDTRDSLTSWLLTRGVKVSNDPPPAKP